MAQDELIVESLTAYEVSYTGVLPRGTTLGGSFFVNQREDSISFTPLAPTRDPYTPANPPPGWQLPPVMLGLMAQAGIYLPRTAFTYFNLGPLRQTGVELWLDQRFSRSLARIGQLLLAVGARDPGRPQPVSGVRAEPAADPPFQRRGELERLAAARSGVRERRHRRVLE